MTRWMGVVAALALAAIGCGKKELTCPAGRAVCSGACVDLAVDETHCGACGTVCAFGEICQASACSTCASTCPSIRGCIDAKCLPDLFVSCFSTGDLRPLSQGLLATSPARTVSAGPVSLANLGGRTWAVHSQGTGARAPVVGVSPDPGLTSLSYPLGGAQLQKVRTGSGLLFVSDATSQNLVILSPATGVLDDVPLGRTTGNYENPSGIAVVGQKVYVALQGDAARARASFAFGQQIAVVTLPPTFCATPPCSTVTGRLSLDIPGAYDAPGLPYPSDAVAVGSRVFVTLANLMEGSFPGFLTDPAGNGKLLVIDTGAGDALSVVDLGAGCTNPGSIAASGTMLLVACGGTSAVVTVDVSGATPAVVRTLAAGVVSGGVAVCGGQGFVTDQFSGKVAAFDLTATQAAAPVEVCPVPDPNDPFSFAWASDVTCAP